MNILLITHEMHPLQGSECAMGWNTALALSQKNNLTVICASGSQLSPGGYKKAINEYRDSNNFPSGIYFEFIDQPFTSRFLILINKYLFDTSDGVGSRILFYAALNGWHKSAFKTATKLTIEEKFDLVHQLTPISFLSPGFMWKLNIPFFWGPVGGMYVMPSKFSIRLGLKQFCFETIRGINVRLQQIKLSMRHSFFNKISYLWVISNSEMHYFSKFTSKISLMVDSAPPIGLKGTVKEIRNEGITICWSGRHASYKALDILLLALSKVNGLKLKLIILGAGPKTEEWKDLALKLGLNNIEWSGHLNYQDALSEMSKSHIFVHTSLREAASHVIMEAMGLGLPVICHDVCGMSSVVDESSGVKIPFVNYDTSVTLFAQEIQRLAIDPSEIKKLSIGAMKRADNLSWNSKAKIFEEKYIECLENI
jgi:glycosyltransferase involved in cell wall biosynthesis